MTKKILICLLLFLMPLQLFPNDREIKIRDIQYSQNQGGGYDCYPSPRQGTIITLTGVLTALEQETNPDFFIQDTSDFWSGIYIYNNSVSISLNAGDSVLVTGTVDEYYGNTEIKDIQSIQNLGPASGQINPIFTTTGEIGTGCHPDGEKYEGILVTLTDVVVTAGPDEHGEWRGDDGSGECHFGNQFFDYEPQLGQSLTMITGVVNYAWGNFIVNPRSVDDIMEGGFYPIIDSILTTPDDPYPGDTLNIMVDTSDPDGQIIDVSLMYGYDQDIGDTVSMTPAGDFWQATIALENELQPILYYQVAVTDNDSNTTISSLLTVHIHTASTNADTLTVMTWNILSFPGAIGTERIPYFRDVVQYIRPDILVVQEIESLAGTETFLSQVLNYSTPDYSHAPWSDGPDSDNMLFYQNNLYLDHYEIINTQLRDIAAYYLVTHNNNDLLLYSAHLKAGSNYTDQRLQEVMELEGHVSQLSSGTRFLICGDLNLYNSSEPAYQEILNNFSIGVFDPLDAPGNWHSSSQFAYLHTQSTRVNNEPDGGSTGGLDDRFDFILASQTFSEPNGPQLLQDSYQAFGNDGNHLNLAINSGTNTAVPQEIANALYHSSDHLPVIVKIIDPASTNNLQEALIHPESFHLDLYPNPFNSTILISAKSLEISEIKIFDIRGEMVYYAEFNNFQPTSFTWNGNSSHKNSLPSGIYLFQVTTKKGDITGKAVLLK